MVASEGESRVEWDIARRGRQDAEGVAGDG